MAPLDRKSQEHLYIQIADSLRRRVASGEFPAGGALPTEAELCAAYGVSRYPMRQAMAMLVEEGLLSRTRGKGTFVRGGSPGAARGGADGGCGRSLALLLPGLGGGLSGDILAGFGQAATAGGYATFVSVARSPEHEMECIERVIRCGAAGVVVFPHDRTLIDEPALDRLIGRGVYVSLIDRNPGLEHIDYIGSDNSGGGYMAAYHIRKQGYASAVFVTGIEHVSTVDERFAGFEKGAGQFGLRLLGDAEAGAGVLNFERFVSALDSLRSHLPFAVFALNDGTAEGVMAALAERGLAAGEDVGVIGFDNSPRCDYLSPPLTSIAQNGLLIGETAARLAMQKIESGSGQSVRHILPTQLVPRKSCGEDRFRQ